MSKNTTRKQDAQTLKERLGVTETNNEATFLPRVRDGVYERPKVWTHDLNHNDATWLQNEWINSQRSPLSKALHVAGGLAPIAGLGASLLRDGASAYKPLLGVRPQVVNRAAAGLMAAGTVGAVGTGIAQHIEQNKILNDPELSDRAKAQARTQQAVGGLYHAGAALANSGLSIGDIKHFARANRHLDLKEHAAKAREYYEKVKHIPDAEIVPNVRQEAAKVVRGLLPGKATEEVVGEAVRKGPKITRNPFSGKPFKDYAPGEVIEF